MGWKWEYVCETRVNFFSSVLNLFIKSEKTIMNLIQDLYAISMSGPDFQLSSKEVWQGLGADT